MLSPRACAGQQEKSPREEAHTPQLRAASDCRNWRKPCTAAKTWYSQLIN